MLDEIKRRVMGSIARALVTSLTEGEIQTAKVSVLADEELEDVERVQNYGFSSRPEDGAQGLILFAGGNREHGLLISADFPLARFKVEKGEVAVYSKFNSRVYLKKDGSLELASENLNLSEEGFSAVADKVSFENAAGDELIDLIVKALKDIAGATYINAGGAPTPLVFVALAALTAKIEAFKK